MATSLVTYLVIGAVLYWVFFMGGLNQVKGMLGGLGGSSSQSQTNVNGKITQTQTNRQSNGDVQGMVNGIQGNVNELLRKSGVNSGQNVSIQRRDDRGNQFNKQSSSFFATRIPRI